MNILYYCFKIRLNRNIVQYNILYLYTMKVKGAKFHIEIKIITLEILFANITILSHSLTSWTAILIIISLITSLVFLQ